MSEDILIRPHEAVLEIRMNRPAKKNALTQAMYAAIADAMQSAEKDDAVRAILIGAEGDMFTAGNDLADFSAIAEGDAGSETRHVSSFLRTLAMLEKPLIAAVAGGGVGVGATMLLHCDIVVIAEDAQLVTPFTQLGLTPEAASSLLLPELVGYKQAYRMLALGLPVSGSEAAKLGIATEAVPRGEVEARAMKAAEQCCARPPEAMRITKRLLRDKNRINERLDVEQDYFSKRLRSPEARAAFEAFFKR